MDGLNTTILRECFIPLPGLSKQQQIANQLEKADQLCRRRQYALNVTEAILAAAFDGLFLGAKEANWDRATLSELVSDFDYGTSTKCSANSALCPVLRIPNVIGGAIDARDLKFGELTARERKKLRLQEGDVLFVRTNGNSDNVGRCAVFDRSDEFYFASYLIRARLTPQSIMPTFLSAYLRSPAGRRSMEPSIRTTAGQYNISVEGLRDVQAIMPPLDLQRTYTTLVERVESLRAVQREALRQAHHLFASLLQSAFHA